MPCRLAKCLAVGMSPDLIRKEDLHRTQAPSIIKSKKTRVSKFKVIKIFLFSLSFEQQKIPYSPKRQYARKEKCIWETRFRPFRVPL